MIQMEGIEAGTAASSGATSPRATTEGGVEAADKCAAAPGIEPGCSNIITWESLSHADREGLAAATEARTLGSQGSKHGNDVGCALVHPSDGKVIAWWARCKLDPGLKAPGVQNVNL